jgi:hypothetical protein
MVVPPPRYEKTRVLGLRDAWELLDSDQRWELAERYRGGRVKVGTPPIRPSPQGGAVGVAVTSPDAVEGRTGIKTDTPRGPAGARWEADRQQAFAAFEDRLRTYSDEFVGEERLFRIQLVVDQEVIDERIVATGELSPDPEVLDGLSLTYVGVLAGIALAFALGVQGLPWWARALLGAGIFLALALALRAPKSRQTITRFSRWALPGAHDSLK